MQSDNNFAMDNIESLKKKKKKGVRVLRSAMFPLQTFKKNDPRKKKHTLVLHTCCKIAKKQTLTS